MGNIRLGIRKTARRIDESGCTIKKALFMEDTLRELAMKKEKLEYFRKKIMDHLEKLEKEDMEGLKKSLLFAECFIKGGYPVGTIRVWKGRKYVKTAPGKWRPKYDSYNRGAKMAIAAIKRKIAAAKDAQEMLQIVLVNRERFSDKDGHPLPFVQELHNYIEEQETVNGKPSGNPQGEEKPKQGLKLGLRVKEGQDSGKKPEKEDQGGTRNLGEAGKAVQPTKKDEGGQINTPERDTESKTAKEKISPEQQAEIKRKLENFAVPMMEVEYSREDFNRLFPRGTAKTPLHEVKLGNDLFDKLGNKDSGARQNLIGALYQTLIDPIAVIKEGNDDVYLKSFTKEGEGSGYSTIIAVEKDVKTGEVVVTSYHRKEREIVKKIKMADGIAYLKDDSGSRANEDKSSLPSVSPESGKKSSPTPPKIDKLNLDGLTHEENRYSDSYYMENPAYNGANTEFYLQEYENELNSAVEKFANSVMDGKPKKAVRMGLWNYNGTIDGRKVIISRKAYDDRYIEISIAKDEDDQPETEKPEETEAVKKAVAAVLQSIPIPHLIKSFINLWEDEAV